MTSSVFVDVCFETSEMTRVDKAASGLPPLSLLLLSLFALISVLHAVVKSFQLCYKQDYWSESTIFLKTTLWNSCESLSIPDRVASWADSITLS